MMLSDWIEEKDLIKLRNIMSNRLREFSNKKSQLNIMSLQKDKLLE
jgi:hypothetical protein